MNTQVVFDLSEVFLDRTGMLCELDFLYVWCMFMHDIQINVAASETDILLF